MSTPVIPAALLASCPRCLITRRFDGLNGSTIFRCSGCEWVWAFGTQSPTGTGTATLSQGGTSVTVASGGAAFTAGMRVLYDTGSSAEVFTVGAGATGTNIPVSAALKNHAGSVGFGQLLISSAKNFAGGDEVPPPGGWGF